MALVNANVESLKRAYARWSETRGRSVDDWLAIASPKFRMRSVADLHVEGKFSSGPSGPEGLRFYLVELVDHWIMERHDVERLIADGDQVAAHIRAIWRNRETNKRVACDVVDLWTFEDGLATSMLELFDTAAMVAAATADAA